MVCHGSVLCRTALYSHPPYKAKLDRNLPVAIERSTPYSSHNLTEVRELWEAISIDDGMVALPDSFVAETRLPKAQRFPWDPSKGLYFLNGYHNLHCLVCIHLLFITTIVSCSSPAVLLSLIQKQTLTTSSVPSIYL